MFRAGTWSFSQAVVESNSGESGERYPILFSIAMLVNRSKLRVERHSVEFLELGGQYER